MAHAVNPAHPALMGSMRGDHVTDVGKVSVPKVTVYRGRGLEAPMAGQKIHKKGSQGNY